MRCGNPNQALSFATQVVGYLARQPCDHPNCSAFRLSKLWVGHRPLQAALSGSLIKAPGFAGGYLLEWSGRAPAPLASDAGMERVSNGAAPCPTNQSRPLATHGQTIHRGHKEPYSTASPHDRCTFDCGRSSEAGTRLRGRTTVPIIAGLGPSNTCLRRP